MKGLQSRSRRYCKQRTEEAIKETEMKEMLEENVSELKLHCVKSPRIKKQVMQSSKKKQSHPKSGESQWCQLPRGRGHWNNVQGP